MSDQAAQTDRASAYFRIDRFIVPEAARGEFLSRVRQTHELLATQPGFIRDQILERAAEGTATEILTVAEWENEGAVANAKTAVQTMHRANGFDPKAMFERLGIKAEMGNYAPVA